MNRTQFLQLAGLALPFASIASNQNTVAKNAKGIRIPPYLEAGNTIGIVAPAGYISLEEIQPCIALLKTWGYNVLVGPHVGKQQGTFAGTDAERAADLQAMINNPAVHAILCARGGYGCVRIIDLIDWQPLKRQPKWIIGFSDITFLHGHLQNTLRIASIHGKMCGSFDYDWSKEPTTTMELLQTLQKTWSGEPYKYTFPQHVQQVNGTATGVLVGGNLKCIESMAGSSSHITGKNQILFVEDVDEALYSLDRMFWQLERAGILKNLKGLVVGGFKTKPDPNNTIPFHLCIEDMVKEKVSKYGYPVGFNFPVGHQKNNVALKCGMVHTLHISTQENYLTDEPIR
ncbi:MAG: LD-carboxypeptidase [Bacteroidetes bacterium]|nr:MAG: LD-carboxypeptidase [Bacteroidota bacterium]TAF98256.1 MAG: LD-carboxypeptidase [Bacteroidota bacterium]